MMFRLLLAVLLVSLVSGPVCAGALDYGEIIVHLTGFRNNEGEAKVVLYNSEAGFPGVHEKSYQVVTGEITEEGSRVNFTEVPWGSYALEVLHDENLNGQMDVNWLKMPKEGYGFSNNAKGIIGPPSYDKAMFHLTPEKGTLVLKVKVDYL